MVKWTLGHHDVIKRFTGRTDLQYVQSRSLERTTGNPSGLFIQPSIPHFEESLYVRSIRFDCNFDFIITFIGEY